MEAEVTIMASGSGSNKVDIGMHCVTCGIHRLWTSRMWACDVCEDYSLCESCHNKSLEDFEVPLTPPGVHCHDHPMSAHVISSICDGCESDPIWNRRWHCTVCVDFDLCEACYGGLDVGDMLGEHLKEHPMIDVEVFYSNSSLLELQPRFDKPKDSQWSYKVGDGVLKLLAATGDDADGNVTNELVGVSSNNDDHDHDDDTNDVDDNDNDNNGDDDNANNDDYSNDDDNEESYTSSFGFLWVKREPMSGASCASNKAIECNSVPSLELKEQINPNFKNSFPKEALQASQAYGMLNEKMHKLFLSHAGTEKDFVEQLNRDLLRVHHFGTFFDKDDESLPIGEPFPEKIFDAAKHCQMAIVVISHEYFIRKWPMLELAAFVAAQKRRPELKILPIFYRLTVKEFKKRQELFWKSWNEMGLVSKDGMDDWKEALKVISRTNGLEYDKKMGEVGLRDKIVESVYKRVNPELMWDDSHVQGKSKMQKMIQEMIQTSRNGTGEVLLESTLRMGLYGMGGCGKTTMCKVLCNQMMPHYLGKVCHIEFGDVDVLQTRLKLLQGICQLESNILQMSDEGQVLTLLKTHIHKQRLCLIVDNVSDNLSSIEEARTLMNLPFKEGSLIVVSSRSSIVLAKLKIERELRKRIPSLSREEAKALFSHHAGCDTSSLTKEQMKTMESFVERCNFKVEDMALKEYHPLALKVLGSRVGDNARKWQSIVIDFKFYEEEEKHPIFSILRLSFDTLNVKYQMIFLDIALFTGALNGSPRMAGLQHNLRCLHGERDKLFGDVVVEMFLAKSLVEYYNVETRNIHVHELYREFARMEVEKAGLQHGGRCCFSRGSKHDHAVQVGRVRIHDHPISHITKDILSCKICAEAKLLSVEDCANLVSVDVPGMENLKQFDVSGGCPQLTSVNVEGAVSLQMLYWEGFEGKSFPNITSLESLEVLVLWNNELESPQTPTHGCLDFSRNPNLEILILSYLPLKLLNLNQAVLLKEIYLENCQHLERLEGLEALTQLEKLYLRACTSLVEFPSLAYFPSLNSFWLDGATKVKAIHGFAKLTALQELDLRDVGHLEELSGIDACLKLNRLVLCDTNIEDCSWIGSMKELRYIYLSGMKVRFVPICSDLCKLSKLWLQNCEAMEGIGDKMGSIPPSFPQSLQNFIARKCRSLNTIPHFQHESTLEYLDLSFTCVDDVFGVTNCKELQQLHCVGTQISSLPDLSSLSRLKVLDVSRCELLTRMDNIKSLPALENLNVFGCTNLLALPDLQSSMRLMRLNLFGCPLVDPNVVKLPSVSTIGMNMEDTLNGNEANNYIDANECENETPTMVDFQVVEPTHKSERCKTFFNVVAMGSLFVWWLWRRRGKYKLIPLHEIGKQ